MTDAPTPSPHHPSCRPEDISLMHVCSQCGHQKDAWDIDAELRQAADKLAAQEFFHDGLSADLLECKDKAHAYMEGWQDAVAELRALAAAQERKP